VEESSRHIKLDKKVLKALIGSNHSDVTNQEGGSIECTFCGTRFRNFVGLVQHVMFKHPAVALSPYKIGGLFLLSSTEEIEVLRDDADKEEEFYELLECSTKVVDRLSDTNPEDRAVDELYPYERCDKVYNTEDDLESHVKMYHGILKAACFVILKEQKWI
jgi:uncharacterized C2H2 Zn-finger protein